VPDAEGARRCAPVLKIPPNPPAHRGEGEDFTGALWQNCGSALALDGRPAGAVQCSYWLCRRVWSCA